MSVRVPTGEIRRTCQHGTSGWQCCWDLDLVTRGDQVVMELTTQNDDERPRLTVALPFDREQAEQVLDLFLAAMVEAGQRA
jgi:hypothetical protein